MNGARIAAIVLIVGGILALVYGGFTYTEERHEADLGPLDVSVEEKETVNIPAWAGFAALLAGGVLLVLPQRS